MTASQEKMCNAVAINFALDAAKEVTGTWFFKFIYSWRGVQGGGSGGGNYSTCMQGAIHPQIDLMMYPWWFLKAV